MNARMKILIPLVLFFLIPGLEAQASATQARKPSKKITSEVGLNIPAWGVAVDAVYDKRLDNLIPGYKIMNVVLSNRGATTIYLDSSRDKWVIVDSLNHKHTAINYLRQENEKLWNRLPDGLKAQLEYPQAVRVGNSTKIDLFFPVHTELANFRGINWTSSHFKKEFTILTDMEKGSDTNPNEEPLPKQTPSQVQSLEKYEDKKADPANTPPKQFDPQDDVTIPMD